MHALNYALRCVVKNVTFRSKPWGCPDIVHILKRVMRIYLRQQ